MNNETKENLEISLLVCENGLESGTNIILDVVLDKFNKKKIKEKILEANLSFTPLYFFCNYKKRYKTNRRTKVGYITKYQSFHYKIDFKTLEVLSKSTRSRYL
ncbi:hypothetical protein [Aliarcobacter butzleri]|uniref:hypothetical protein n=1 Tax=Aliarcobacter butzleri TaxID=28197 RepID=UPI001269A0A0|nr:hypothetical protein [Aliarcobacter butzleri]